MNGADGGDERSGRGKTVPGMCRSGTDVFRILYTNAGKLEYCTDMHFLIQGTLLCNIQ